MADETPEFEISEDVNTQLDAKIKGHDGVHHADVFLEDGVRKLQTNATATVESLFGEAVLPFTAIRILTVGANTNTIRVQIPDDSVDVTTTKTASEVTLNDLAKKVRDNLNAASSFNTLYKASVPRDSNLVCIEALLIQTRRPDSGDVVVTSTGTITFTLVWDTILDQSLALALFPHPKDCTKGTISVVGEINVLASGRPPKRILLHNSTASPDMSINGSVTPVVFKLSNNASYDSTRDMIVTELRFEATANTMTMGSQKYVGINAITVGHLFEIRSDGNLEYNENMKNLTDVFHSFAFGEGSKFQLEIGSGDDSLVAVFARPFFIRKAGTFGTPDDITVTVRDDLSSTQIVKLQVAAVGFFEE